MAYRWTEADLQAKGRGGEGTVPPRRSREREATLKVESIPKKSKYRNRKTEVDGIVFHSKKEANRYGDLKLLEREGKIRDLELQPKYPLVVRGQFIATYIADFTYWDCQGLISVVEDAKGMRTPVYKLKKKLFLVLYTHVEFRET